MKFVLVLITLLNLSVAEAGLRYSHLIYDCTNTEGVRISVLRPGPATNDDSKKDLSGTIIALNNSLRAPVELGMWCSSKANETNKRLRVREGEYIAEEPTACRFELDKKSLEATYEFKQWTGYVRGIFSRPEIHNQVELTCVPKDEIVKW